jgi:hypothetical protein
MLRYLFNFSLAVSVALFSVDSSAGVLSAAPSGQFASAQNAPDSSYGQGQQYPPAAQPSSNQPNPSQAPPTISITQADVQDDEPSAADVAADKQHGVARLSIVQGDVNVKRGDNGELTTAIVNAPLMAADHLQTSNGSRAEVELDYANLVRLAPDTELGFATLEYHRYQLQLGAGTVIYRVLRDSDAQVEVDTPSVGFRPLGQGEFRISVLSDGTTQITARSGQGEIFGPRGSQRVPNGVTVMVRGNPSDPEFQNAAEIGRDQFDDWSNHRDSELLASQSYAHVSPDVYGADDLDAYGNWVPSQYGQVWAPQQTDENWSPYSNGQWNWEDYYGWTWVDYSPWGWAPYHYGRWFYNGGYGWCWWPGAYRSSFYWSPALVGFFGWGGYGFGFGIGGLGWVSLGPYERCHRWWGRGGWGGYGNGYYYGRYGNFSRGFNVASTYRNAAYRGGAVTAPYNGFGGPHGRFSFATRAQLTNANAFRGGGLPITPSSSSYRLSNRQAAANPQLAAAGNRQFFGSGQFRNVQSNSAQLGRTQTAGAQAGRTQNSYVGANRGGAGYTVSQNTHGVTPNMQNRSGNYAASGTTRQNSGGWQRFGDPGNSGSLRQGFVGGASDQSGWHRFGQPQSSANAARYPSTSGSYGTTRQSTPRSTPSYGGQNYSSRPLTGAPNGGGGGYPSYSNSYRGGYNAPPSGGSYGRGYPGTSPSYAAPRYSAPSGAYGGARYSAPPGSYSAPRGAPGYSYGGGSHYSAPSGGSSFHGSSGGSFGGGGHSSGGSFGGGHSGGGGGGGGHHR